MPVGTRLFRYLSIQVHTVVTGPFQENSFLILDPVSREGVCIDPGDDPHLIIATINDHDCNLIAIINTHAHMDHIGAVSELKEMLNIPFYLHKEESLILDSYEETCQLFNLNTSKTPDVDYWFTDESSLTFGNLTFKLIFTPGHTPGGTSFMIEDHVFVGDTLFRGSVGRTDLPGGNWGTLEKSLLKLMENVPLEYSIHSGHGPDTTMNIERKENPFLIPLEKKLNYRL